MSLSSELQDKRTSVIQKLEVRTLLCCSIKKYPIGKLSMAESAQGCEYECPVEAAVDVIGGKWKPQILYYLLLGTQRHSDLKRGLPKITQRMLTLQLRELERDGIVQRTVYAQVPPKVEYSLTELGMTLVPLLEAMFDWGENYLETLRQQGTQNAIDSLKS